MIEVSNKSAFDFAMQSGPHHFGLGLIIILLLAAGFIAITFIQSGLDKVFNYKENLGWIGEQFSKTFLKSTIKIFLPIIMIGELAGGLLCLDGIVELIRKMNVLPVMLGFAVSGLVLLMLLFGQRVSKQYVGAVGLTGYFIIILIGLLSAAVLSI